LKRPRTFHLAFRVTYQTIVSELITDAKLKPPSSLVGRDSSLWVEIKCLWDTGATHSVITQSVVRRLGLRPTGRTLVHGINSAEERATYMIDIGLPSRVAIQDVAVTECEINSPGIDLIVGMNIISMGDFAISNGPGHTIFSFAMPPFPKPIDLLEKSNAVNPKHL